MAAKTSNIVVAKNIRSLREAIGLTQETLAQYLGISREQLSYYETGSRSISSNDISKLANLFCVDEYDLYDDNLENRNVNIAFAFRADTINPSDLENIAKFKKIVRNYISMQKVLKHE